MLQTQHKTVWTLAAGLLLLSGCASTNQSQPPQPKTLDYSLPEIQTEGYPELRDFFLSNRETARPKNNMNTDLSAYEYCEELPVPQHLVGKKATEEEQQKEPSGSLMAQANKSNLQSKLDVGYTVYEVYAPTGQCANWEANHYMHTVSQQRFSSTRDNSLSYSEIWKKAYTHDGKKFEIQYTKYQMVESDYGDRLREVTGQEQNELDKETEARLKPRYTFYATMTSPSGFDNKKNWVFIHDHLAEMGHFSTTEVRNIDTERSKTFHYDGSMLNTVTRKKNGDKHGLEEIKGNPVFPNGLLLCFENGVQVEKANCEVF